MDDVVVALMLHKLKVRKLEASMVEQLQKTFIESIGPTLEEGLGESPYFGGDEVFSSFV